MNDKLGERKSGNKRKLSDVSLFSDAGCLGLEVMASVCDVIFENDIDSFCCKTSRGPFNGLLSTRRVVF